MAITKTFDSARLEVSIEEMLFEWLTDAFGDTAEIFAGTAQDSDLEGMNVPVCEYQANSSSSRSTGAGALALEAVWKNVTVPIGFKTRSQNDELDVKNLGDTLFAYFISLDPTKGRKALGVAGMRVATLEGPLDENTEKYYHKRWILTFRVLAKGQ
jgi:hypothetical protein